MTAPLRLLTIDYPDGNRIALRLPEITAADRAAVREAFARHFGDIDQRDKEWLLLEVAERIHEDRIYEKVAERRGVLAL